MLGRVLQIVLCYVRSYLYSEGAIREAIGAYPLLSKEAKRSRSEGRSRGLGLVFFFALRPRSAKAVELSAHRKNLRKHAVVVERPFER